jgi:hypothetical protein
MMAMVLWEEMIWKVSNEHDEHIWKEGGSGSQQP